jgi:hypothetical protein
MRKAQDDVMARSVAESKLAEQIDGHREDNDPIRYAKDVLGEFKAVEFETTTRKVGDDEIHLRRLVITGPWEVDGTKH